MEDVEMEEPGWNLDTMPIEIIIHICTFLEPDFILTVLSKVNKRFEQLSFDESLWRIRIARRWRDKYPPVEPEPTFSWSQACAAREYFVRQWSDRSNSTESLSIKAHYSSVDALLLLHNGSLLLSGSRDRTLALWKTSEMCHQDCQKGLLQRDDTIHKGWVWSLNFNEEKSQVVSSGWDNMIHLWNLTNSRLEHQSSINTKTALLCSDLSSNNLVTVGTFDKKIKTYDLRINNNNDTVGDADTAKVEEFKIHKLPVLSVVTPPGDTNKLISASEDSSIALIDRRMRKVLKRIHFSKGFPMVIKPFGNTLYVGDKVGNLHLVDLSPDTVLKRIKTITGLHAGKVTGIDTGLGGIVTCSSDSTVKLMHSDLGCSVIDSIDSKDFGEVTSVTYSNGFLASGHSLETIQLWRPKVVSE